MKNQHTYRLSLQWTGKEGNDSVSNDRLYEIQIAGKEVLKGSADTAFYGDATRYNPEDMLLSALSSCHMMSYLYVCRKQGIEVLSYQDNPEGVLKVNPDGSGQFEKIELRPIIKISKASNKQLAIELHKQAGQLCFIANSCRFPITYKPVIQS